MVPPALLVFSGVDGAGKSTQIERLAARYQALGQRPVVLWTRIGYTPGMEFVKRTLRLGLGTRIVPASGPSPARARALRQSFIRGCWMRLALLDMAWRLVVVTRWYLLRGRPVICDRFWEDSRIDVEMNFPGERIASGWCWKGMAWMTPRATAKFLLWIPPELRHERSIKKGDPFPLAADVFADRQAKYVEVFGQRDWQRLDGTRSIEELSAEIAGGLGLPISAHPVTVS